MTKKSTYPQRSKSAGIRFDEKVGWSAGCWHWMSAKIATGYGVFWLVDGSKKSTYAHRFAWERANLEKIPSGMVVMHLCNNKSCVNPAHLALGTPKENSMAASRDGLAPMGERNGGGKKLTAEQAREIFTDRSIGCALASRKFGVSAQTIKSIRRRRIWKSVNTAA